MRGVPPTAIQGVLHHLSQSKQIATKSLRSILSTLINKVRAFAVATTQQTFYRPMPPLVTLGEAEWERSAQYSLRSLCSILVLEAARIQVICGSLTEGQNEAS